jgi:hypothetical protein
VSLLLLFVVAQGGDLLSYAALADRISEANPIVAAALMAEIAIAVKIGSLLFVVAADIAAFRFRPNYRLTVCGLGIAVGIVGLGSNLAAAGLLGLPEWSTTG